MEPPVLSGDALAAITSRGSHVQIIAAAGSGKTEVVSQRVALLLAEGVPPEGIVAFTFTERAAAELKARIAERAEQIVGPAVLDLLGQLFVGTIHAYCFRLLTTAVPRYETFDVLDPNQLTAFLVRESKQLDLQRLDDKGRTFSSAEIFLRGLDVVENELIDGNDVEGDFGDTLRRYYQTLDRYRLLTFGLQVVRAVHELDRDVLRDRVHASLRHLIVDEYQDVNPAQEELIRRLVAGGADDLFCTLGDSGLQLRRRPLSERERDDAFWRNTLGEEEGDSLRDDLGLAGTGRSDDLEVRAAVMCGLQRIALQHRDLVVHSGTRFCSRWSSISRCASQPEMLRSTTSPRMPSPTGTEASSNSPMPSRAMTMQA